MATTLQKSLAYTLGNVVSGTLQAVRAVKLQQYAEQESAFQAAVADGMSYDAQIAFRKKQLTDEKASSFPDADQIQTLNTSLTQLKKLQRFANYRQTYQESLASLKAGKETAEQHLSILQSQLSMTTDPELQAEIRSQITDAQAAVKTSQDNILTNEVTRARNDGTVPVLQAAISKVTDRKAQAQLDGNEEAVSAYDVTLGNLKSQLETVKVADTMTKVNVTSLTSGMKPADKLALINQQLSAADPTVPITVDGKKYASASDYWSTVRGAYLSGNGSGVFADFFKEMQSTYSDQVNAAIRRDGYASTLTLDKIVSDMNVLKAKPEMQPFLQQINDFQTNFLGDAIQSNAQSIVDKASYTQDFKSADDALLKYGARYGIDVSAYRTKLADEMTKQALAATGGDVGAAQKIVKDAGVQGATSPQTEFPIAQPGKLDVSAQFAKAAAPGTGLPTIYNKITGEAYPDENAVAKALGVAKVDFNNTTFDTAWTPPQPKTPETTTVTLPAQTPQPQAPAAPATVTPPPTDTTIAPQPTQPAQQTQTPAPAAPAAPKPASTYTGASIVDYLKSTGQDTSFNSRKKMAEDNGITNYVGSAEQNTALLKALRG